MPFVFEIQGSGPIFQLMKGFITTAPISKEATKLLLDRDALVKIYNDLISQGKLKVEVTSGSMDYSVFTTPAMTAAPEPIFETGTEDR
jgi:hypothetical protein